jgi:hypothetical protein
LGHHAVSVRTALTSPRRKAAGFSLLSRQEGGPIINGTGIIDEGISQRIVTHGEIIAPPPGDGGTDRRE